MRRRCLLSALGTGAIAGLGGCLTGYTNGGAGGSSPGDSSSSSTSSSTSSGYGPRTDVDLPVPAGELYYALPRDRIPAIVDPAFADDWSGLDPPDDAEFTRLPAETAVVGVERDGEARAYPLLVLDRHEVVNDEFGGPLLVTYCPLCGSAVVAERRVHGEPTTFGVSGALWRNDLVLYDRLTDSLWSQLLATAIRGPATGETLELVPATLRSWSRWRADHPETQVLLPPPRSNTVRGRNLPYEYFNSKYNYESNAPLIGYEYDDPGRDSRQVGARTLVIGVVSGDVSRAYPFPAVREAGVINDRVGDLPVVVTTTPDGSLAAYDRRPGGSGSPVLRFRTAGTAHLRAGGSRWERATGRAVTGPYAGTHLREATDAPPMFWVGWSNFHPDTSLYGVGGAVGSTDVGGAVGSTDVGGADGSTEVDFCTNGRPVAAILKG